ncbi:MAG: GxxExxY protein, partial [Chthoniobacteraceae bacterium]
ADFHDDDTRFILKEETHAIIGCAMDVLNGIGHGLREKTYERGLIVEFRSRGISYECQRVFPVLYKGELADEFVPDLIAFGKVVVDAKVIERIADHERGQMLNYLRITQLRVGLIVNFKRAKLEFERVVL